MVCKFHSGKQLFCDKKSPDIEIFRSEMSGSLKAKDMKESLNFTIFSRMSRQLGLVGFT